MEKFSASRSQERLDDNKGLRVVASLLSMLLHWSNMVSVKAHSPWMVSKMDQALPWLDSGPQGSSTSYFPQTALSLETTVSGRKGRLFLGRKIF